VPSGTAAGLPAHDAAALIGSSSSSSSDIRQQQPSNTTGSGSSSFDQQASSSSSSAAATAEATASKVALKVIDIWQPSKYAAALQGQQALSKQHINGLQSTDLLLSLCLRKLGSCDLNQRVDISFQVTDLLILLAACLPRVPQLCSGLLLLLERGASSGTGAETSWHSSSSSSSTGGLSEVPDAEFVSMVSTCWWKCILLLAQMLETECLQDQRLPSEGLVQSVELLLLLLWWCWCLLWNLLVCRVGVKAFVCKNRLLEAMN
jgi:hypothetical protein